jgi:HD-GYP domain-containing protein (c-di-GMP phosphodiesterase class II)
VAEIVRASHENWDGSGYPDGLKGEEIPLASRIIAVCDAYHAMTSERPYKAAVGHEEALAELRRCAGTHFDPAVVDVLCREFATSKTAFGGPEDRGDPTPLDPTIAAELPERSPTSE